MNTPLTIHNLPGMSRYSAWLTSIWQAFDVEGYLKMGDSTFKSWRPVARIGA